MGEWLEKTLGELTSYMAKGIPPKYVEEPGKETIRVLNQKCNRNYKISYTESRLHDNGVKKAPEDKMLRDFDVLINSTGAGTAGRVAQIWHVPEPTTLDGHMILLRPTPEIDNLYYGYAIKAFQTQVEGFAEGSTGQTEINKRRLLDEVIIRFPVSLDKQMAVGKMLKTIDEKIQNNEAINDKLEEQALALFKACFVDYSFTGHELPSGWREYHLNEFLPVITGKKNANVSSDIGRYPFFSCSQGISWTNDYSFEGDAILVAGNGDFNVKFYSGKFEAYQRTYVLIPRNPHYTAWLFYAVKYNLSKITVAARGSVINFITKGNLENFSFYAPSVLEDFDIINHFTAINKKIAINRDECLKLAQLRDALLPRLMAGELDISDIDI